MFPPAYVTDEDGRPMHSWRVLILPFLEESHLYDSYDFSEPWDGPNNRQLITRIPEWLVFPGDPQDPSGVTNYLAVTGSETAWPGSQGMSLDDIPNPGNTIMIVENRGAAIRWTEPRDLQFATMNFSLSQDPTNGISSKFSRAGVACVDGTLRGIPKDIEPEVIRGLLTVTRTDDRASQRIVPLSESTRRPKVPGT